MSLVATVALFALAAEPRWEMAAEPPGLKIFSRTRPDSEVKEMKATGMIDFAPQDVFKVIQDLEHYKENMPYTAEATEVKKVSDTVTLFYSRLDTPMVSGRDYVIKLTDESKWNDGKGFLKVSWTIVPEQDELVPLKKDIVRIRTNEGFWNLEPRDNGAKTFATYYIYTSPGGSIPTFIANQANAVAVPNVFDAIKKTLAKQKK